MTEKDVIYFFRSHGAEIIEIHKEDVIRATGQIVQNFDVRYRGRVQTFQLRNGQLLWWNCKKWKMQVVI
ncbi:hypothetical protein SAMN02745116_01762 [Pilibacter termitis]|uniref:Uncharacterized protein n=1 Tax=Pilibacter termitis TaxID=263852 RepID=A0A1T4PCW8_9ENTE|nr:hypothetical protein [Pilibacter termitis]SJZ89400.1 hypothetical protein SAMN02745116_01762 [Pilibacter termitis]